MAKLVILGSSSAVPDEKHATTHMILAAQRRMVMVDCTGDSILRLRGARLEPHKLTDLILTHFHPDHVAGVPQFLMNLWLLGRQDPLSIYGLDPTIERAERLLDLFELRTLPDFFPVIYQRLPAEEMSMVLETDELRICSSPVRHIIPTLGLRFESIASGKSITFSSDTEPCPQVARLAHQSDVLIHEATGEGYGHSSARQAGEIAHQAEAGRLVLIHYPVLDQGDLSHLVDEAKLTFDGAVVLAEDLMQLEF